MQLTSKERHFVRVYVTTGNAAKAYRTAYGTIKKSAKVSACRLLKKPNIQQAVSQYQRWEKEPGYVDKTYVIEQLKFMVSRCLEGELSGQNLKGAIKAMELLSRCLASGALKDETKKTPSAVDQRIQELIHLNR